LDVLAQYQNSDGGFGHGLEADFWNPESSPMQTWAATEIVHEVHAASHHPIVTGILRYLESQAHFDGHSWSRTIPSNNDHPHAEWWTHEAAETPGYNPTASLAGFALRYTKAGSPMYQLAVRLANEAFETLLAAASIEVHELSCFQRLFTCASKAGAKLTDLGPVKTKLHRLINESITRDTSTWKTGYVCRPSRFIRSRDDELYRENAELVDFEKRFLEESQLDDGSWPVNWHWANYPNEWPIAQGWWKSVVVIENLLFLSGFTGR